MRNCIQVVLFLLINSLWLSTAMAALLKTTLVSKNGAILGNDGSYESALSADGRFVTFTSDATNLVTGDTNAVSDIFVHDRQTGTTSRVSVKTDGTQGVGESYESAISADGRFVAYSSYATNLVDIDTNGASDIFLHDRQTGITSRVSVSSNGTQADDGSNSPTISADGKFITYTSSATNLVSGDTNGYADVFIYNRQDGTTSMVSLATDGTRGSSHSEGSAVSGNGRYVAFQSYSNNLVNGDNNGTVDVFVHDRESGITSRVSVNSDADEGNGTSYTGSISDDGRFVTFTSYANNLVDDDSNGVYDVFVHDRQTGATSRVSVKTGGIQGNDSSGAGASDASGRYFVFGSEATNLVDNDTNGIYDVFVHDRLSGTTSRVSVDSNSNQANGYGKRCDISGDGNYVTFESNATNLVPADTNNATDIFVRGPLTSSFPWPMFLPATTGIKQEAH